MTAHAIETQNDAADPKVNAFVTANAGTGKTLTLVNRVARLLLHGTLPEAILCVTYTKAAAAEMQRRLFDMLGTWSVAEDDDLAKKLAVIAEEPINLGRARALFARALETPGGLKIQTIHAFCEKLLRRFPLEAGVFPGFSVLEDAAAAEASRLAREELARMAVADAGGAIGRAYAHFAVELDFASFEGMLATFEGRRAAIKAYFDRCAESDGFGTDVWRACGFDTPADPDELEAFAVAETDWATWARASEALLASKATSDQRLGGRLAALAECGTTTPGHFSDCWRVFSTQAGEPTKKLGTVALDAWLKEWLVEEQTRLHETLCRAQGARIARDTVMALTLARVYAALYEDEKARRGALDFSDLIARTLALVTVRSDAAWVLYKLDGGIDHVLVDEAQDTAPEQWDILRTFSEEFFAGAGGRSLERTIFAVGDEKQSIYSFQGADPEQLAHETASYRRAALAAGRPFLEPALVESWRSTPRVLALVDAVFADPATRDAVPPASKEERVRHESLRPDHPGSVDLWPIYQDEPVEEADAWDAPLDAQPPVTARKRLAQAIAAEIAGMISRREGVHDRKAGGWRPVTAGDVLILVRGRDALFEEIIRALKKAGVPVAGADRLKLSDHVVFQDLMALCRFALFPDDDLTLASLLRSPFCDVDEQGLYDLAQPRADGRRLWAELSRRGDERPEWGDARGFLGWARGEAGARSPFDFLARALNRLDGQGRSMRRRILTRLGREAEDALDEVLSQALAAESRGVHDLEGFTAAMERAEIEVKRELESGRGEVRVMTVHGAKGLEAPVVILPDTCRQASKVRGALLSTEEGGFLWAPRQKEDCDASEAARERLKRKGDEESLRLLYVALTRARDRLIVCGRLSATAKGPPEGSWYQRLAHAFERDEVKEAVRRLKVGEMEVARYGEDPPPAQVAAPATEAAEALPAWAERPPPEEPAARAYAAPSTLAEEQRGPAPSPLSRTGGLGRFRRGDIIHRLLQLLPDIVPAARAEGAERLLAKDLDLTPEQRAEMAAAALSVLEDPRFAEVFGPGSRAEAAIAGGAPDLPATLAVSGRVDRMVVMPDRVLVVDFKTNRPSPDRIEDADRAYHVQMAVYVAVLRAIFPGRRVEAALVWTDGPKLMPVPEGVIAATLAGLNSQG